MRLVYCMFIYFYLFGASAVLFSPFIELRKVSPITLEHGGSMTRLFPCYPVTRPMKQQLFLSYGWGGENQGEKQGWLNAPHFAKCSSGQYITRKWTDRLRKRTERHQWSIVCSQGAPSNSSGSQYIKETKIHYTICTEMFYKYKLRHLCFSLA